MRKNSYPNINELIKQASEQNTTISLRIKDSTRALFEILAQKNNLNLSSIINKLLDDYAEDYIANNLKRAEIDQQVLRRRIETAARKAGSLDPEFLFLDIANEYRPDALLEQQYVLFPNTDIDEYARDFTMWAKGHPTKFFADACPLYIYCTDGVIHAVKPFQEASVTTDYATSAENSSEWSDLKCLDIYLPAWRWAIVVTIVCAATDQRGIGQATSLGETTLRKIAYLANTVKDNAEFAQLVGKILIQATGLEHNKIGETATYVEKADEPTTKPNSPVQTEFADRIPTWGAICVAALESLGGYAHTSSIYPACRRIAIALGKPITNKNDHSFNMTIQGALEMCSHDCNPNTKQDYFHITEKGSGMWQLNPGVHFNYGTRQVEVE